MKSLAILALMLVSSVFAGKRAPVHESIDEFDKEFNILENDAAKKINAKRLADTEEEINKQNELFNSGKSLASAKLNQYAELTGDEFQREREGVNQPKTMNFVEENVVGGVFEPPESVKNDPINRAKMDALYKELDNRGGIPSEFSALSLGIVTKSKQQRRCGSCAAFATAGAIETCMLNTNPVTPNQDMDLSEQEMVDCAYNPVKGINGCKGALPESYPKWFVENGGAGVHEHSYGYIGNLTNYQCQTKPIWPSGSMVVNYFVDYQCTEDKMKKLIVNFGAIISYMNASSPGFSVYDQGIWDRCIPTARDYSYNHAVMLIGYGNERGVDYWLGKNSWGTDWGSNGIFKVRRGVDMCAIERVCVALQCKGGFPVQRPPPPPPPPVIPKNLYCNVNSFFPNANGVLELKIGQAGFVKQYISHVQCRNGICSPVDPTNIHNCCVYICGEVSCDD